MRQARNAPRVPNSAPHIISLGKCTPIYIRENAISAAKIYDRRPLPPKLFESERAAAKLLPACPEGKDHEPASAKRFKRTVSPSTESNGRGRATRFFKMRLFMISEKIRHSAS